MGEKAKQEETPKVEAKPEEAAAAPQPPPPEPVVEEAPKPPSPLVLFVELHCVGCAKKIEKSLMRIRGVEGVVIDMDQNQVTIKGVVEHQAVCNKIMKKTKRKPKILSPQPSVEGEPIPEVVASQVSGLTTVELNINMHCEPCALQLKKKIHKMRGVQTAETYFSTGKVIVTGTMDGDKLVNYVYKHTKKLAKIVPQPEPEPEKQEEKKEDEKSTEEPKSSEEKKEGETPPPPEEKKEEGGGDGGSGECEGKQEEPAKDVEYVNNDDMAAMTTMMSNDEENMKRMMYYYQPMYVIERIPPAPQLFSDENPNACCIS